ncbi:ComF operon protein C [Pediococcus claussenii ATCC BAA-344]|uniref:ComF operon protein C n=1 Tax=Pediococcus claussenii (strain ATCC BAA-344 / DSM 14800 / JCM 18046 / KCTC 3811 / LMG 21948 / P06) TaxID=701521 RepID=G8PC00_PEDCP|nr:ComF operon protein C [Pediococcus claussenii ATCC BAA-344]KRN20998.1 hypothetical protein IV79_GL000223 [Pediococcus claussenii]
MDLEFILSWQGIQSELVCVDCKNLFARLEDGQICKGCGRSSQKIQCADCSRWDDDFRNIAMYEYNDAMKDYFNRYKFLGDYYLANVFNREFSSFISKNIKAGEKLVTIPVDDLTMKTRGFNQVDGIIGLDTLNVLNSIRQSGQLHQFQLSRQERLEQDNHFTIDDPKQILGQEVVILDDIYTTGKTVRDAARVLKNSGCKSVRSITLCR